MNTQFGNCSQPVTRSDMDTPDLPEHWTPGARETWTSYTEAREDLSPEAQLRLTQLCDAESLAETLLDLIQAAGYVETGTAGQVVAHPLLLELRHARALMARLTDGLEQSAPQGEPGEDGDIVELASAASAAGRALVRNRWSR